MRHLTLAAGKLAAGNPVPAFKQIHPNLSAIPGLSFLSNSIASDIAGLVLLAAFVIAVIGAGMIVVGSLHSNSNMSRRGFKVLATVIVGVICLYLVAAALNFGVHLGSSL